MRQIVLDTETTGLDVEQGHHIIEIGCVELVNRKLTGNHYHQYLNPQREIEAGAIAVHGLTNHFLKDKPLFCDIAKELMAFIADSELIIHNAPFDVGFLNYELSLTQQGFEPLTHYCPIIDTLIIARQLHMGQRNNLDALCKRYGIDNSKRELHGALLDANLLAQVYLAMTGGQGSFFDSFTDSQAVTMKKSSATTTRVIKKQPLTVLKATQQELSEHEEYLQKMVARGECFWLSEK